MSLTKESPKVMITGSFFLRSFLLPGLCPLFSPITFSLSRLNLFLLVRGLFSDTSGTCGFLCHFDCPHQQKERGILYC